jgi:hypothetical protein
MAKDDSSKQTEETSVGKRLTPDWICSVGEETVGDIQVLPGPGPEEVCRIIVMTFRHLFCCSGTGEVLFCKRLDYPISAFTSFPSKPKFSPSARDSAIMQDNYVFSLQIAQMNP